MGWLWRRTPGPLVGVPTGAASGFDVLDIDIKTGGVDWLGSVLITLATMAGAFAIVKSSEYGLTSARTLGVGGVSLVLLAAFLALEARIENPIMPLRVLRLRSLMGSSLVRGLLITGMFSAFFLGSLYLERVLGYNAIDTGLAFLPLTALIASQVAAAIRHSPFKCRTFPMKRRSSGAACQMSWSATSGSTILAGSLMPSSIV